MSVKNIFKCEPEPNLTHRLVRNTDVIFVSSDPLLLRAKQPVDKGFTESHTSCGRKDNVEQDVIY